MTRRFSEAERAEIWDALERGEAMRAIARKMGRAHGSIRTWVVANAGRRPRPPGSSELRLSLAEREEISRGLAGGLSLRAIAAGLNRAPSTVSREVAVNGGRRAYRALRADRAARWRARRPKAPKLAACPRLRAVVEAQLAKYWSPEEISAWLARAYPDDAEMRVSHETIYMSLFVQGRGALRQELHRCLRSGRALRRPKARTKGGFGQGQITDKVMISERPAEVEDRAVPGHWEGDLIYGRRMTCIGTLVERSTRYVMLFPLPDGHTAEAVRGGAGQEDPGPAHRAATLAHLGPGTRDGRARPVHYRHGCAGLLLRSEVALAARQQREHERPAASVLAEGNRSLKGHVFRAQRHRSLPQWTASTNAWVAITIGGVQRGCCDDRLSAQAIPSC